MFTGIIESIGQIGELISEGTSMHITVNSQMAEELKIDQSVSHNGVCLTVVGLKPKSYVVTAIKETLDKTNLKNLKTGDLVNLERAMKLGDRLDGHLVQGHVDEVGVCKSIRNMDGSWLFTINYNESSRNITIEKGSITINGVSLTVINSKKNEFSVAIIPFTYENTNFKNLQLGDELNLEFDLIGKYISRLGQVYS